MSEENGRIISSPSEMVDNLSFQAESLAEVVEQAHQKIHQIEKENQNAIENIQLNIKQEVDLDSNESSEQQNHSEKIVKDKEFELLEETNLKIKEELDLDEQVDDQSILSVEPCTLIISTPVINPSKPEFNDPYPLDFDRNTLIGQPKLQFDPNIKPEPEGDRCFRQIKPRGDPGYRKIRRPYPFLSYTPGRPEIIIPDYEPDYEIKTENFVPKIDNVCTQYDKEAEEIYEKEKSLFFLCNECSEEKNRKIIFPDGLTLAKHVTAGHQPSPQTTGPQFQFTCYGDGRKYHCFPFVQEVVFVCKYGNCPKRFTNDELLQNHINTCHNKGEETHTLRCQYKLCGRRFPNQDKRRKHVQDFHIDHSIDLQDVYGSFWIIKSLPYGSANTDQVCDLIQEDVFREIQRFYSHTYQLGRIVFIPSDDFSSSLSEHHFMNTNMLPCVDPNDVELQRFERICSVTHIFEEIKSSDVDFLVNINNVKSRMLNGGITIHNSDADCVYFIDDVVDIKEDKSELTPIIKPKDVEMDIGDLVFLYGKPDPNYSANEQDNRNEEECGDGDAPAAMDSATSTDDDDLIIDESKTTLSPSVAGKEKNEASSTEDTDFKKERDDDKNRPITISPEPFDKICKLNERTDTFEKSGSVVKVNTELFNHEASSPEQPEVKNEEIKSEGQSDQPEGQTTETKKIKKFKTHNRFQRAPFLHEIIEIKTEDPSDTTVNKSKATRKKSSESKNDSDLNVRSWKEKKIGSCISIPECRVKNVIGHIRKRQESVNSEIKRSKNSSKPNPESSATLDPESASLNKESEYSLQQDFKCTDNMDVKDRDLESFETVNDITTENNANENESNVGFEKEVFSMSPDPSAVQIKTENDVNENQTIENLVNYENKNESHVFPDENFDGQYDPSDIENSEENQSNDILYIDINNSNDEISEKNDMSCDQLRMENKDQSYKMAADLKNGRSDINEEFDEVPVDLKMDRLPVKVSSLTSKHWNRTSAKHSKLKNVHNKTLNGAVENSASINSNGSGISGDIEESHDQLIDDVEEYSAFKTVKICDKTVDREKRENRVFKESHVQFSDGFKMAKFAKSFRLKDKSGCHSLSKDSHRNKLIENSKLNKDSALSVQPKKDSSIEAFTRVKNLSSGNEIDTNKQERSILHASLAENVKMNKRFADKEIKYSESVDFRKGPIEQKKDKSDFRNSNKDTKNVLYQKQRSNKRKIKQKHTTCIINGVEVKECVIKVFKMDQDDVDYICKELKHGHKTDYANYLYSMQKIDARNYDQLVNGNAKFNMKRGKFKRILEVSLNLFKTRKDLIDNPYKDVSDIKKRKSSSPSSEKIKKRKINNDDLDYDWLMEFDDSSSASEDGGEEDGFLDDYDFGESDNDFICPEPDCGRSFSNSERLDYHLSRIHGDDMYTERKFCPIENCDKNYSTKGNLMMHIKKDHGEDVYREIRMELYGTKTEDKKVDQTAVIRPAGTCLMPTIWRKPQPLIPPHVKDKITKTSQVEQPKNVREVEDIKNILSEFTQNGKGSFYSILSNK